MDLYIHGQWHTGDGKALVRHNPANGEQIYHGHMASSQQVSVAVESAHKASHAWASLSIEKRYEFVNQFCEQLSIVQDEFATLISMENGKPLWEAKTEVTAVLAKAQISLEAQQHRAGILTNHSHQLSHRPMGVLAVLGPFNFPAHLANGHIMPGLIAGNTIIYKASELCPKVAQFYTELWHKAKCPPGVLNLITGDAHIGKALMQTDIDGCLFTGSYQTGQALNQLWANHPEKLLALEMGGNNPMLIWDVQDIQAAAMVVVQSAFITTGQRCTCARRLVVPNDKIGAELIEAIVHISQNIQIGPYDSVPTPFMGPLISKEAKEAFLKAQEDRIKLGAKPLLTANSLETNFVSPAILDVTDITCPDEECFGPMLHINRVDSFANGLALVNQSSYGLSAGILSDDEHLYQQFATSVKAGIINWNTPSAGASSALPFGGVGRSGNHRPSAYYAADYCNYPVASHLSPQPNPMKALPGLHDDR